MVVWIVLAVVVLFFAFACYKSADVWNGGHIALGAGIFLMTLVFMFLAACSLRTHQTWMKQHDELTEQLAQAKQMTVALQRGAPFDSDSRSESIEALAAELDQLVFSRGRAWRNLIAQVNPQGGVMVSTQAWGDASWRRLGMPDEAPDFDDPAPAPEPLDAAPVDESAEEPADAAAGDGETADDGASDQPDAAPAEPDADAEATADDAAAEATDEAAGDEASGSDAAAGGVATAPAGGVSGTPHGMEPQLVVYAFAEAPLALAPEAARALLVEDADFVNQAVATFLDAEGKPRQDLTPQQRLRVPRVPYMYLGEFRVVAADPNFVQLEPTEPTDLKRLATFSTQNNFTWVLFDKMPQDSHDMFANADPESLQALFAWMRNVPPASMAGRVVEYVRDGNDGQNNDPPSRRWAEVKFVKPFKADVDVEGDVRLPDRPFDPSGRAMESSLWAAGDGPLEIEEGQQGIFDPVTAQNLVRGGVAEVVRQVFVRKLRDYDSMFRSLSGQINQTNDQSGVVEREISVLEETLATLQKQAEYRSAERDRLGTDQQGLANEVTVLDAYVNQISERLAEVQDTLKTLYRENQILVGKLPR